MLQLRTFGGLSIEANGAPLSGAAVQRKTLALLSLLAAAGKNGLSRDKLVAYLWPESDAEHGRSLLKQACYALRRDLHAPELFLGATELRFNPDVITSEVQKFEDALERGDRERAVSVYAGPFLDGFYLNGEGDFERWAEVERARFKQRAGEALETLATEAGSRGDTKAAVECWRRLAALDPLSSRVAVGLMKALVTAGDRGEALQYARIHETLLRNELDAAPDAAVAELTGRLRAETAGRAPARQSNPRDDDGRLRAELTEPEVSTDSGRRQRLAVSHAAAQHIPSVATLPKWLKGALGTAGLVVVAAGAMVLGRPKAKALTPGKVTQITFEPGLEIEPAIAPSGTLVAYAAGPLSASRIYVRQPGGRPVPLTPNSGPSQRRPLWSPDGTRILFEAGTNLFVMAALGGAPRPVANGACCAAWSPDARLVAYVRSARRVSVAEPPESIYVMPPDGGPSQFVGSVADPHSLTWSPDGQWLALVSGNDQFSVGVALLGNKGPSAIVLVPAVGGTPMPVTDKAALNVSPVWTPDARHLLFVSDRDGARDVYVVRLLSSGAPAGQPSRLTTGLNAHSISLSADGTRLAYSVYMSRANVWAVPIPTDGPVSLDRATQVTTGNQTVEAMTLSPDGRWLYFDSDRSGNADIYRMPVGGGEPEQLTTDPADDFTPDVSPDGRSVAFHSLRFGTRDVYVMPAEGGEAQRVTDDPGEERSPTWSPDGQSLSYFLSGTDARAGLYVISKDRGSRWGQPRQVWNHPNNASWAPDGRTLVTAWTDGVWLIPAAGGAARRAAQVPDTVNRPEPMVARWSRDGRTIYFKASDREGRASFWALPATGGRPRLLVRFDDPAKPSYRPRWATDGRRFYFAINDRQSDIYVAELHGLR